MKKKEKERKTIEAQLQEKNSKQIRAVNGTVSVKVTMSLPY